LIENGIDLAIRGGDMKDSTLKSRKIFELKRKLVASSEYVSTMPQPKSPADFNGWDWVWFTVTPNHRTFVNQKTKERKKIRFKSRITVDNGDAMCNFVMEGLGLATPTTYLIDDNLKTGKMVEVLPDWRIEPIDVHAV
jgi:DNA-binding transcriptional LysR family regulator